MDPTLPPDPTLPIDITLNSIISVGLGFVMEALSSTNVEQAITILTQMVNN